MVATRALKKEIVHFTSSISTISTNLQYKLNTLKYKDTLYELTLNLYSTHWLFFVKQDVFVQHECPGGIEAQNE